MAMNKERLFGEKPMREVVLFTDGASRGRSTRQHPAPSEQASLRSARISAMSGPSRLGWGPVSRQRF